MHLAKNRFFFHGILIVCLLFSKVGFAANNHSDSASAQVEHHDAAHASTDNAHAEHADHAEEEPSVVGTILHHIADANEFHVLTIGEHHYAVPLPVMIYNKTTSSWSTGMSSDYHHEKDGLILSHGRIVDAATHKADSLYDFSITKNVFTMMLGFLILLFIFMKVKSAYEKRKNAAPSGLQSFFEPIITFIIEDVAKPNLGAKYEKYLPYLLSIFFFILINNLIGLVPFFPGSANVSGNISFTLTLAVITFIITQLSGTKDYWTHVFAMPGVPKLVLLILTPLEIVGLFTKPFALTMRLFANITAGHIIILSLVSLIFILGENGASLGGAFGGTAIAIPFVLFMNVLELLVAFLQAYIFTLLSAIFISMAIEEHHHEEAHH